MRIFDESIGTMAQPQEKKLEFIVPPRESLKDKTPPKESSKQHITIIIPKYEQCGPAVPDEEEEDEETGEEEWESGADEDEAPSELSPEEKAYLEQQQLLLDALAKKPLTKKQLRQQMKEKRLERAMKPLTVKCIPDKDPRPAPVPRVPLFPGAITKKPKPLGRDEKSELKRLSSSIMFRLLKIFILSVCNIKGTVRFLEIIP
jgi:hypothetical protein